MSIKEDLELFRKYCGKNTIVTSTHINQSFDNKFASVNKNIQINIAKARDHIANSKNAVEEQ